ncbi:antitoxin YezG family protein [Sutcliffiella horikoshii]|uniref:antitoxin YezG family protein n=1 Tax=Sutcliffiella horikoshii TaxID=79883 RepID=UPI001CFD8344|nr:antitoxin YezG family protein [Sutcliffiella horikoshii]
MNEAHLDKLYQQVAEVVIDTIPEEWSKVYLYGEVVNGSQTAFFYYYPKVSDKPIYSHDITEQFAISELEYTNNWNKLVDLIQELQKEFKDSGEEPWTNFTLVFDKSGKFHIEYNYDDLSSVDLNERKTIWKYKNLGLLPKSNTGKKYLDKFLSSK